MHLDKVDVDLVGFGFGAGKAGCCLGRKEAVLGVVRMPLITPLSWSARFCGHTTAAANFPFEKDAKKMCIHTCPHTPNVVTAPLS